MYSMYLYGSLTLNSLEHILLTFLFLFLPAFEMRPTKDRFNVGVGIHATRKLENKNKIYSLRHEYVSQCRTCIAFLEAVRAMVSMPAKVPRT
jgi:hypothetical protein